MSTLTLIAYYGLFWWLTLFAVLSFGLRTQADEGDVTLGTTASAPAKARIWRSLMINTFVSLVVFGVWYLITHTMGIGIDEINDWLPVLDD